ncbi:unnamed protein product [Echinostoma caproni]|uniref:Ig-like domain-containing protein n=1 Tax=Echinostoma caproni TaxID=27848 RepID=A0A183B8N5_9TREM|nr:unnamed protein product [Echinostoma caproni]
MHVRLCDDIQLLCTQGSLKLSESNKFTDPYDVCDNPIPMIYVSRSKKLYLQYESQSADSVLTAHYSKIEAFRIQMKYVSGIVYEGDHPLPWMDEFKDTTSEVYREFQKGTCNDLMEVLKTTDNWQAFITCRLRTVYRLNVRAILKYARIASEMRNRVQDQSPISYVKSTQGDSTNMGLFAVVDLAFNKTAVPTESLSDKALLSTFEKSSEIPFKKGYFIVSIASDAKYTAWFTYITAMLIMKLIH